MVQIQTVEFYLWRHLLETAKLPLLQGEGFSISYVIESGLQTQNFLEANMWLISNLILFFILLFYSF